MRNSFFSMLLGVMLLSFSGMCAESAPGASPQMKPKGGWQEHKEFPLPLTAAKLRIITKFERQGYTLKHEIELGKHKERLLMLWEQGRKQMIVMLWRIDVDKTGCSIGEVK